MVRRTPVRRAIFARCRFLPVSFKILPQRQLILFTYAGLVGLQESTDAIGACARHPDYRPWQRQFCDLSRVTGVERDFPKLMKMQAKIVEDLQSDGNDLIVVFYAPTQVGQILAHTARKSWDGLNAVIVLIHDDEAEALALLGLPETSLSDLLLGNAASV